MEKMFPLLTKQGKMGPLELSNRIIMAPMGSLNGGVGGYVTERGLKFYGERAKGGVSMIIVECTAIDDDLSIGEDNLMRMTDNSHITGHARLVSEMHDYGVKAVLQLCHIGHQISLDGVCGGGSGGEPGEKHDHHAHRQQQGKKTFFHGMFSLSIGRFGQNLA